jgi:hypothetical protein
LGANTINIANVQPASKRVLNRSTTAVKPKEKEGTGKTLPSFVVIEILSEPAAVQQRRLSRQSITLVMEGVEPGVIEVVVTMYA